MEDRKHKTINSRTEGGQTAVETALLLAFIFMLVFFIVDVALLWFNENSLNNAARVGARTAAVEPTLSNVSAVCATHDPGNRVLAATCDSIGRDDATVSVVLSGDVVTVNVGLDYSSFFLNPFLGSEQWDDAEEAWETIIELSSSATMKYEF